MIEPTFWKRDLLRESKFFSFRLDPVSEKAWWQSQEEVTKVVFLPSNKNQSKECTKWIISA